MEEMKIKWFEGFKTWITKLLKNPQQAKSSQNFDLQPQILHSLVNWRTSDKSYNTFLLLLQDALP